MPLTYPARPFTVVTSPTYVNKRLSDYAKVGPLPTTQLRGRRDYAISLGRPTARRATRRGSPAGTPTATAEPPTTTAHSQGDRQLGASASIVNVDEPICEPWCAAARPSTAT